MMKSEKLRRGVGTTRLALTGNALAADGHTLEHSMAATEYTTARARRLPSPATTSFLAATPQRQPDQPRHHQRQVHHAGEHLQAGQ